MVLRGYQLKDALRLKHVPKVKTTITVHKSGDTIIITPLYPHNRVTSFSYFKVEIIELDEILKRENCA